MTISDMSARPISRRTFTFASALSLAALGTVRSLPSVARAATAQTLPDLTVVAKDYSFTLPATASSGFTTITLDNQSNDFHHAMFIKLNDGATIGQVKGTKSEGELAQLGKSLGGPMAGPMGKSSVVLDLQEGSYAIVCVIPGPDGMPHYLMGMVAPLDVTAGTSMGSAPKAGLTVDLEEMEFKGLPSSVPAGQATWEVTNTGTVMHEMIVMKLGEGITPEQVLAILEGPSASATPGASPMPEATPVGPPPFMLAGGAAPMDPGYTVYPEFAFEAGNYAALCMVVDPTTGKPHAAMGMLMGFTVA